MSKLCVIEINDAGITAVDADGVKLVSPGYAVASSDGLLVGQAAYDHARLNPRRSYDRFWSQLDQQPLNRPAGDAQSHADLAYYHLRAIWQSLRDEAAPQEIIFAVPTDFGKPQLALLLGIAQALEMPVCGLIAGAVAAAGGGGNAPCVYVDVELHRITATQISGGQNLQLGMHKELLKQGLSDLYKAWADMIAGRFVQETRYDPLHQAQAEQMLYTRLPQWLASLPTKGSARFELQVGQRSHAIDVTTAQLVQAGANFYRPIIDAAQAQQDAAVLLSHRVAALPGLQAALKEHPHTTVIAQTPKAIAESVFDHLEVIRSDPAAPAFITRLPGVISNVVAASTAPQVPAAQAAPTHLLCQWQAYPINAAPLVLEADAPRGLRVGELPAGAVVTAHAGQAILKPGTAAQITLNGSAATSESPLSIGDCIGLGNGQEMRLIALVSDVQASKDETP